MSKLVSIFLALGLMGSPVAAAQDSQQPGEQAMADALGSADPAHDHGTCKRENSAEVLVCGRAQQKYRIDATVLAASRAAEALPPKPPLTAADADHCSGPECGGGTIPLVGMALTALRAAELAAQGDDWRDAFRTRPDQYQIYQQTKEEESHKGRVSLGIVAGNK